MTTKTKPETPIWVQLTPIRKRGDEWLVCLSCCKDNSYIVPEKCYDKLRAAQDAFMYQQGTLAFQNGMAQGTLKMLDAVGKEIESIKDEADPSFIAHMFEWIKAQTE